MRWLSQSFRRRLIDRDLFGRRQLLTGRVLDAGGGRTRGGFPAGRQLGWVVVDEEVKFMPSVVGDAQRLPFAGECFDAVKSSELTGYLVEPQRFLQEVKRVLKPGGVAVVTSPFLTPFDREQHDAMRLTSAWWEWVAQKVGLTLLEIRPQGFLLTVLSDFERYWIAHWVLPLRLVAYGAMFPVYELLFWWEQRLPVPGYFRRFTTGFLVVLKKGAKGSPRRGR